MYHESDDLLAPIEYEEDYFQTFVNQFLDSIDITGESVKCVTLQ